MVSGRIYIHIGLNKTASTTIQEGLINNGDVLLGDGYLYPKSGLINRAHHNLGWGIMEHERFDPQFGSMDELVNEIKLSKVNNVIISSENFSVLSKPQLHYLREKLKISKIKIIVYLRRQDQWLQSLWSEYIKKGLIIEDFDFWIKGVQSSSNITVKNANYFDLLEKWSQEFNSTNIIVRPLEAEQLSGSVFDDFLKVCGIDDSSNYELPENLNISPGIKTLEVIRAVTRNLKNYNSNKKMIVEAARFIRAYGRKNGWDQEKLNLIDHDSYTYIKGIYDPSNKLTAKKYLRTKNLFQEEFVDKPLSKFALKTLENKEVLSLLAFVVAKLQMK